MTKLTERRKADRETMATMVQELCQQFGATCEREDMSPRELWLNISLGPVRLTVDFDGDNVAALVDNYCLPWNIKHDSEAKFRDDFGWLQLSNVNQYHRRKCTAFAPGIDALLELLGFGFQMIRDGRAFVGYEAPERRDIAA